MKKWIFRLSVLLNVFFILALVWNWLNSPSNELGRLEKDIEIGYFQSDKSVFRIPKLGGPNKIEMLFSIESIKNDFPSFEILKLEEVETVLNEGDFHNGLSKVIRFFGKKTKS